MTHVVYKCCATRMSDLKKIKNTTYLCVANILADSVHNIAKNKFIPGQSVRSVYI